MLWLFLFAICNLLSYIYMTEDLRFCSCLICSLFLFLLG
ncbi:unnamed protein product [Brassica rapa]|uniref:Uncharacterized protein n=2 Tax=Brassica TaxID=3705 RepID=A0A8D9M724_BRACM|nr:unnamed protein product [Brassica napus]CAG7901192.1 unnamed protein product [Brassica rapa]